MAAWWDPRDTNYFTFSSGTSVSALASRAPAAGGTHPLSLGGEPLLQGTSGNQPTRAAAVASLNNKPALLLDGTDDFMAAATAANYNFMSDGSGFTLFVVRNIDATAGANATLYSTHSGTTVQRGSLVIYRSTPLCQMSCSNGAGAWVYDSNLAAAHATRGTSAWQAFDFVTGSARSHISGASASVIIGTTPNAGAPEYGFRLGRLGTGSHFKGHIAQIILYRRVLTAAERTVLATWANGIYGVTV